MAYRVSLSGQEVEFAVACKHFLSEKDPKSGEGVQINGTLLLIPEDEGVLESFFIYGVARLIRVLDLAIKNQAIPSANVSELIADIEVFHKKLRFSPPLKDKH